MITIGLTGSIGMGKSTTARVFAEAGAYLWDADAAVHRLYGEGGAGARAIEALAPAAVSDGAVDRAALRDAIIADQTLLKKVEAAIHPLVAADRAEALTRASADGYEVAVLDIPLIFETGAEDAFDHIVVVSAPADIQRARVLERPGMSNEAFEAILAKQVPDAKKRARADFIVETGDGMEAARTQVAAIMEQVREASDA
ncbi:MAG: dephospho-CoA kinase [Pseudomonadota bacterium]